jgi:hypothetical protein
MATSISAYARCSDGTFISLVNNSVTENTLTEIQTGGTGLAQVAGVSVGQAYVGRTITHMVAKCSTEDAGTAQYLYGYILGPDGKIVSVVQGGGGNTNELPALTRPVRLTQGMTFQARFDAIADGNAQMAALSVVCSDGCQDVFFATMVNNTKTSLVNKDGSSIGQALAGKMITRAFAMASTSFDINESQAGNGALYVESADGQLKAMYPPQSGAPVNAGFPVAPFIDYPVKIDQNDTLSVMGSHS